MARQAYAHAYKQTMLADFTFTIQDSSGFKFLHLISNVSINLYKWQVFHLYTPFP